MCGIFGWALAAANRQTDETLARVTKLMTHREPDGAGQSSQASRLTVTTSRRAQDLSEVEHRSLPRLPKACRGLVVKLGLHQLLQGPRRCHERAR